MPQQFDEQGNPIYNIRGADEVIQGVPLDMDDPNPSVFQYVPPKRTHDLDEALQDLREGGYFWKVKPLGNDMWRLEHKNSGEPHWGHIEPHELSTRELDLRGLDVYYQDPTLPDGNMKPGYFLHDRLEDGYPGRIWHTEKVGEGWVEPEPGERNREHLRKTNPRMYERHWGDEAVSERNRKQQLEIFDDEGNPRTAMAVPPEIMSGSVRYLFAQTTLQRLPDVLQLGVTQKVSALQRQVGSSDRLVTLHIDASKLDASKFYTDASNVIFRVADTEKQEKAADDLVYAGIIPALAIIGYYVGGEYESLRTARMQRTAKWPDVMAKAKRLVQEGKVTILVNRPEFIMAHVIGDHGEYDVEIRREDPNSAALTQTTCECPWEQYRWDRTRKWKPLNGRMCSHLLAAYWKAKATPLDLTGVDNEYAIPVGQKRGPAAPGQQVIPGLEQPIPTPEQSPFGQEEPIEDQQSMLPTEEQPPAPPPVEGAPPEQPLPSKEDLVKPPVPTNPFLPPKAPRSRPVPQRMPLRLFDVTQLPPQTGQPVPPNPQPTPMPGIDQPNTGRPTEPGGTFSHYAMAERSGDPVLDSLIRDFATKYPELRDPAKSTLACQAVSWEFVNYLRERGLRASTVLEDESGELPEPEPADWHEGEFNQPDGLGYEDRTEDSGFDHCVAWVFLPTGTYMVDFTASQYGYKEFPMVQKWDGGNMTLKREWHSTANTLYHGSDPFDRDSILRHGLNWEKAGEWGSKGWRTGLDAPDEYPYGNYLWKELGDKADTDDPWHDIWAVDVSGLDLIPDPASGYSNAVYVVDSIDPSRLTLIRPAEKDHGQRREAALQDDGLYLPRQLQPWKPEMPVEVQERFVTNGQCPKCQEHIRRDDHKMWCTTCPWEREVGHG